MLECLIVGDSIAVGTATMRPECVSYSVGGWNSWQWNKNFKAKTPLVAKTVIISLGSNDHKYINSEAELRTLRNATKADRVYWILPAGNLKASQVNINYIQLTIKEIAAQYGDVVLPITRLQKDGIHPSGAGYKELAEKTK